MQNSKLQLKTQKFEKTSHFSLLTSQFQGFTLIELLIVVAIISILASLLMVNFIGVRQRGRDAQRKGDLRQIQAALEVYRSDLANYPVTTNFPVCSASFKSPDLASTYMEKVPCDPLGGSYTYSSDGTSYSIIACLENASDPQKDATNVVPCNGTTNFSFTVKNP